MPISPAACGPLARETFLDDLPPQPLVRAEGQYKAVPGVGPIGNATLDVEIESFARPVPATMFIAASHDLQAYHRFTVTEPAGTSILTVRDTPPLRLRFSSWHAVFSTLYENTQSSVTLIVVGAGHNLIFVTQNTAAIRTLLPPEQTAINAALNAALSGLSKAPRA